MKPLTGVTAWVVPVAFLGGFTPGSMGVVLVAFSAFLQSCALPRRPWRWATLALAAWAAGAVVVTLVLKAGADSYFDPPDAADSSFALLAALSAAYLGACLTWAAGRLAREP
ncbi:MAG TPA: hypothetical protein VK467_08440 [Gemmatimonadales bacterium]|jgi:hypothetical protein|nr:hypothetical protein [Gemmatimonadales bacterium]